jgi:8-oxo-dGTP diphosphatase
VRSAPAPGILARGPWKPDQVAARWLDQEFEPENTITEAADEALDALRRRGSPSYDGLAARLAGFTARPDGLLLELQPSRWALRLLTEQPHRSLAVLCLVRGTDGAWLAGRRAGWLATWPGRWALGAGGSVEVDEDPVTAMTRELQEEWSVQPEHMAIEALVLLPTDLVMLVGQAWLPAGATVTPDAEHDEFAWWPADLGAWPEHAEEPLRRMASLLAASP